MIKAHEARANAVASEQQVENWLKKLEPKIIEASKRGEFAVYFFPDDLGTGVSGFSHPWWDRVQAALKEHGYHLREDQVKVGGGLGSMDDVPQYADVLYASW